MKVKLERLVLQNETDQLYVELEGFISGVADLAAGATYVIETHGKLPTIGRAGRLLLADLKPAQDLLRELSWNLKESAEAKRRNKRRSLSKPVKLTLFALGKVEGIVLDAMTAFTAEVKRNIESASS